MQEIPNKVRVFEIAAVLATGAGKFVFMDWLGWRLAYTITAILFWFAYIIIRYSRNRQILIYWGFSKKDFAFVMRKLAPWAFIGLLIFFGIGYFRNTLIINWHILPILFIYPIWGVIQQYLIVGLIAGNLKDMNGRKPKKNIIIAITALVFSAVHYPNYWLIIGTFLLAIVYTIIYLYRKNLFALGLLHGWLGAFYFYTVLNRDPWLEMFRHFL
jgi:membrane protease YdiL (CAAX protease family)